MQETHAVHDDVAVKPTAHYEPVLTEFNAAELALLQKHAAAERISVQEFVYRAAIEKLKAIDPLFSSGR